MPYCEACGKEFTRNIWGELGKAIGTPDLCHDHSHLWAEYTAKAKAEGVVWSAFLSALGLGFLA